ncbi:MAG: L-aspartate oxidase [Legionellales bacterium]|nr:L-aspartate oxidase [Legionellales bacterium]
MIYDVLIIGSGVAGLSLALRLPASFNIALVCKDECTEGSSFYAQGGIAAVFGDDDSLEQHIQDTLISGAGLCDRAIVELVVTRARECIEWLIRCGVHFTQALGEHAHPALHLTREGGHSRDRIVHAADATGREVETTLVDLVKQKNNITIFTHHLAIDLIKHENSIAGIYAFDETQQQVIALSARTTVLATGGASKVYLYTSNPDVSSGDGIAMAHRAGAAIKHMEFNQFHPTCLYHPQAKSFLISEALRGEGAKLRLPDGTEFMQLFDARGELATRDIVARAIDHEMKRLGIEHVLLDISHRHRDFIIQHFPMIYQRCLQYGIDITREAIPVVPAAHYTCGGVVTDRFGKTTINNLFAIGEVACTGLHGANRMASNSLLECLVFGAEAAQYIQQHFNEFPVPKPIKPWDESRVTDSDEEIVVTHNWHELRRTMWNYVGIVRTNKRLQRALNRIELLKQEIHDYYSHFRVSKNLLELRNLIVVAELMVHAALARKENIGLHYSLDYKIKT